MTTHTTVQVDLGDRAYDVHICVGGFAGLGGAIAAQGLSEVVLVSSDVVDGLWGDPVRAQLEDSGIRHRTALIPDGEAHKTVETYCGLMRQLLQADFRRTTGVVALGGGVVGDVAGFAAATALRGVPLVQIPTTLLSMVDSSVGGKTGVNFGGKNRLGAFHQPALVWAAMDVLATLPQGERISGLGEVLKTALVADASLLDHIEAVAPALRAGDSVETVGVVSSCVALKAAVVAADEREAGIRAVLNAGHTIGHGLERVLGPDVMRHGCAVAIGLLAEARWAVRHGHCKDVGLPVRLAGICRDLGLAGAPPRVERSALIAAMQLDKKAGKDSVVVPVPVCAGTMTLVDVPLDGLHTLVPEHE
jgi:3-dehydroquinate synthase